MLGIAFSLLLGASAFIQPAWALQKDTVYFKNGQPITMDKFLSGLREQRVILVGETHDRYDHHLHQLRIIHEIHKYYPDVAIGLEYFQAPFQTKLDDFTQGRSNTIQMLRETEYYLRWRFDHRLYEPIFNFARDNQIPLVALNVAAEITRKVSAQGLNSLSETERKQIPADIDRSDKTYRERLKTIFKQHYAHSENAVFENFYDVQLLWDEGMAETAAEYLSKHPTKKMIILAGMGHIEYGAGIPKRLERRIKDKVATVVPVDDAADAGVAEYVFKSTVANLPRRGLLGLFLEPDPGNQVRSVTALGPASVAGVKPGDVITAINEDPISDLTDIKVSLSHKRPGDTIALQVSREPEQTVTLNVELD